MRLAGLAGPCPPPLPEPAALAVFAGDHGVHAQGVTPWPQEVTAQMVANFLAGGAVVNAFARQAGVTVTVVDVGVAADLAAAADGLLRPRCGAGTRDMTVEPAMTRDEAQRRGRGRHRGRRRSWSTPARASCSPATWASPTRPPSAALIAAFTGARPGDGHRLRHRHRRRHPPAQGRGDPARAGAAPARSRPTRSGVLAAVGGLEHAALAGFILGAAPRRVPVHPRRRDRGCRPRWPPPRFAPGSRRRDGRRAPLGRAGRHRGAAPARPGPAARPRAAAGRGHRRGARAARSWPARCGCCTRWPPSTPPGSPRRDGDRDSSAATRRRPWWTYVTTRTRWAAAGRAAGAGGRRRRGGHPAGAGAAGRRRRGRAGLAGADARRCAAWPTRAGCTWMERPVRSRPTWTASGWCRSRSTTRRRPRRSVSAAAEQRRVFCVRADDRHAATRLDPGGDPARPGDRGGARAAATRGGRWRCATAIARRCWPTDDAPTGCRRRPQGTRGAGRRRPGRPGADHGQGPPAARRGRRGGRRPARRPGCCSTSCAPTSSWSTRRRSPTARPRTQEEINRILVDRAQAGQFVVRLKGGDPYVFGRGGEEVLACAEAGVPVTVVPGVTSAIAVPGGGRHPGHPPRGGARVHRGLRPRRPGPPGVAGGLGRPGPAARHARAS